MTQSGPNRFADRLRRALMGFAAARGREILGVALMAAALALTAAMLGHNAADPSLNHSTATPAQNPLGFYGAVAADAAMQYIGLGAFLAMPPLFALGWRRLRKRNLTRPFLRLIAAPAAMALASVACTLYPFAPHAVTNVPHWQSGGLLGMALAQGTGFIYVIPQLTPHVHGTLIILATSAGLASVLFSLFSAGALRQSGWLSYRLAIWLWHWLSGRKKQKAKVARPSIFAGGLLGMGKNIRTAIYNAVPRPQNILARFRPTPQTIQTPAPESAPKSASESPTPAEKPKPAAAKQPAKVEMPKKKPRMGKRAAREAQHNLPLDTKKKGTFELPPLRLLAEARQRNLKKVSEDALEANARLLENVLQDFGIDGKVLRVRPGPVVTLYELEPAAGIRINRIVGLAEDIARSMSAERCRIAPLPGQNVVGIELPNTDRETVYLRELLASDTFEKNSGHLPMVLGKDIGGAPVLSDLAKMPHLLVAGTTGSGKSVGINTMILSILYRMTPDQCRLILVDPKMLELSVYEGIPHLLAPVVTEPKQAVVALKWAVAEMESRYSKMSKVGVRNIESYNTRMEEARAKGETFKRQVQTGLDAETGEAIYEEDEMPPETLPFIVIIIDEMADLMLVAGKEIEGAIQRLAQMARAAGVHLITATQRPSVDVITGTIKANFPSRISFQVTTKIDSRTVLGEGGGEQLLGMGDMLFMAGGGRLQRIHGPFVSDKEVEAVVRFLKQQGTPDYVEAVTDEPEEASADGMGGDSGDSLYDKAVAIVTRDNRASTSYVQRRLSIGYNRAATLIEKMEEQGVISPPNHAGKREVLVGKH